MSEEKTKSCVMCGKTIPAYSNFCPYCGAKQPWLDEDEVNNQDVKRILKWYQKPVGKFISLVVAGLVIYFVGSLFTLQDGPGHKTVARELNQYLFNAQDKTPYGKKPSVKADKQKGVTIKISSDSKAVKDLKAGKPAKWDYLVNRSRDRSKAFHKVYANPEYAKFKVVDKHDKKKVLLKIDSGTVKYNIADKYKK